MPAVSTGDGAARGKVLLAGVGYPNLRDVSVGPVLSERLALLELPAGVEVHDYSFGAIDAVHRLKQGAYDVAVFFGAMDRGDPPGTIRNYEWDPAPRDPEVVQGHVAEAAQAVISLETTLVVTAYFGALPADTRVFEVEPGDFEFGDQFSPVVSDAVEKLQAMLLEEVGAVAR